MTRSMSHDERAGRLHDVLGVIAVVLLLLGPLLARLRLVPPMLGFVPLAIGGLLALVVAAMALLRAARGRRLGGPGTWAALAAAALFVILAARTVGAPRINDFTTDLDDPPRFTHAATIPANAGRDLAYPSAFADDQQACCADLAPARVARDPAATYALAVAAAAAMPRWTVTRRDPQAGEVEAVAESVIFGFQDDVIVRIRPDPAGGSRVDVRSKSRDGKGDLGANAARIRAYLAALTASAGS